MMIKDLKANLNQIDVHRQMIINVFISYTMKILGFLFFLKIKQNFIFKVAIISKCLFRKHY